MIAKAYRFHGYGSLRGVYSRGQTVRGPLIGLKFSVRGGHKPYRAAIVVSRKVNKSAVARNRIRRRIYEIVRTMEGDIAPGTDLVFTVFSNAVADTEAPKLRAAVGELLQKAAGQTSASIQTPVKHAIVKSKER